MSVQKAAGCIIGTDYPRPIVDHDVVSKENISKMKAAYAANKAGKEDSNANSKRKASTTEEPKAKKQKKLDAFIKSKK